MDISTQRTGKWRVTEPHFVLVAGMVDYQIPVARCDTLEKVYGWLVEILGPVPSSCSRLAVTLSMRR